jgi:aminoglycoside phosphotransferase (APT) family kinase protein
VAKLMDPLVDPEIPTLAAVLDPAELAGQLNVLLPWDTSLGIRVRVLRWKRASRCTFELAVNTPRGWEELIGKVYAEDRSDVYRTMEDLRQAGFDSEAEFATPRAIAFLTPLRLLLCEKAPGTRARKLIVDSARSEGVRAAERCAHWLARFHERGPRSGRVVRLDDQLRSLEDARRDLVSSGGRLADKASRLFERLAVAPGSWGLGDGEPCAAHGTYTPGQVLLSEGRTVTIDWDTYAVADPAFDVARFLVELKRMSLKYFGSTRAFDAAGNGFLETYVATGRSDVSRRLPFQQAAICLDRAKQDLEKQALGSWEKAEAMLNEGLRVLTA